MKKKLRVIELFAGIGAPRKALMRGGYNFEIVDAIEIDKYAVKSYNAMYDENIETKDICAYKPTKEKVGEIDLLFHGSPCQDFSLAGKQAGGDKGSGTRSSLMYETIRIVGNLKPKYVVWENVKNLLSKKHRHNFEAYLETMTQLGYTNYYQVLNAKDYGIPQNRERVFTISIRKDIDTSFVFLPKKELKLKLEDMLEDEVDEKYYLSDEQIEKIKFSTFHSENRRIQEKEYCDTLCARDWKAPKCVVADYRYDEGLRIRKNSLSPCLTTKTGSSSLSSNTLLIKNNTNNLNIRRLTPKESWRLMGFDDEDFEKAETVNSNTQLYKQAGNSIVVNVLEAIFDNLLQDYK